ncbi:MAG: hypothetical protein GY725_15965 [bacterium]|nr:hypothetical protein [bacterium]
MSERKSGLYIAYPKTNRLRPTWHNQKTLVNHQHTKVGQTANFDSTRNRYRQVGHDVVVKVLVYCAAEHAKAAEYSLLEEMHSKFELVPCPDGRVRTKEWFATGDYDRVALAMELIEVFKRIERIEDEDNNDDDNAAAEQGESATRATIGRLEETPMRYRLGRTPKLTAPRNEKTWRRIEEKLTATREAEFDELVRWCTGHDHPRGGKGFVKYCIEKGWLTEIAE